MFDGGKIVAGIVIFLVLLGSPIWYVMVQGSAADAPTPVIAANLTDATECIEDTQFMRDSHMQLLAEWRDDVVRNGDRVYTATNGKTYEKSLTATCLSCHANKAEFCDACHTYTQVEPNCWSCHVVPEEFN